MVQANLLDQVHGGTGASEDHPSTLNKIRGFDAPVVEEEAELAGVSPYADPELSSIDDSVKM